MITDLVDYLNNNLLIAYYCGFDISRPLSFYWTFERFLMNFDNEILSDFMKRQMLSLAKESIIDTSSIGFDSTPVAANTSQNNPKYFLSNKFNPLNRPKSDADCKLGIHMASNFSRWRIEEYFRSMKQLFRFENFRVRKLQVKNALNFYITLCMAFLAHLHIQNQAVKKKSFFHC